MHWARYGKPFALRAIFFFSSFLAKETKNQKEKTRFQGKGDFAACERRQELRALDRAKLFEKSLDQKFWKNVFKDILQTPISPFSKVLIGRKRTTRVLSLTPMLASKRVLRPMHTLYHI